MILRNRVVTACLMVGLVLSIAGTAWASVEYKDVEELTLMAPKIVMGDVTNIESYWDEGVIRSRVTVQVSDYLTGEGLGTETLVIDGGTVGEITLQVSVLPVFQEGDHVLLFLKPGSRGDGAQLAGAFQGAYLTDGEEIVRSAAACRRSCPETKQALQDVLADIQKALPEGQTLPDVKPYTGSFELPSVGPRYELCGSDWTYKPEPMGEPYFVNGSCEDSSAGGSVEQIQQIRLGMTAWDTAGADFEFTYGGSTTSSTTQFNGTNLIYFSTNPPGGGDYVAVNYHWFSGGDMTESDICFNDRDYTWWNGVGGCSGKMDIRAVATHELGHTLCLADLYSPSDSQATMYGYVSTCDTHARDLHSDDINGIIGIYGIGTYCGDGTCDDDETCETCEEDCGPCPPPNNHCEDAIQLCPAEAPYEGTTTNADSQGSAGCGTSSSSPDVWYSYTPETSGTVTIHNCDNPDYDGVMSAHTGCPGTADNQITCDDDGCGSSGTPSTITFSVTAYETYYVRVSGWNGASGDFTLNISGPTCYIPDTFPPNPNPAEIMAYPDSYGASTTSVAVTAQTATDETPPIEYRFRCMSGECSDRDWSTNPVFIDSGLAPNHSYVYQAQARDSMSPPNETGFNSAPFGSVVTAALVPAAPILSNASDDAMMLDVVPDDDAMDNPNWTTFAIRCTSSPDGAWNGMYVASNGMATANPIWQTDEVWGNIVLLDMQPGTTYTFAVKARNLATQETAFGPGASLSTTTSVTGACCVGNSCSVLLPSICALGGGVYAGDGTTCSPNPCCEMEGDVNGDLMKRGDDIQCFIDCILGIAPSGCYCACADVDGVEGLAPDDVAAFVDQLLAASGS